MTYTFAMQKFVILLTDLTSNSKDYYLKNPNILLHLCSKIPCEFIKL